VSRLRFCTVSYSQISLGIDTTTMMMNRAYVESWTLFEFDRVIAVIHDEKTIRRNVPYIAENTPESLLQAG